MGLFSTLIVDSKCANCGMDTTLHIQFKYGELWNYCYSLNDEIRCEDEKAVEKSRKLVVLDGAAEECKHCCKYVDYLIFVEKGVIKSFKKNDSDGDYLILES
jgi:hypothetical protein